MTASWWSDDPSDNGHDPDHCKGNNQNEDGNEDDQTRDAESLASLFLFNLILTDQPTMDEFVAGCDACNSPLDRVRAGWSIARSSRATASSMRPVRSPWIGNSSPRICALRRNPPSGGIACLISSASVARRLESKSLLMNSPLCGQQTKELIKPTRPARSTEAARA